MSVWLVTGGGVGLVGDWGEVLVWEVTGGGVGLGGDWGRCLFGR